MRDVRDWASLLAAVGTLAVAVLAMQSGRGRATPLARSLAALCFVLFGWNFIVVAQHVARDRGADPGRALGVVDAFLTALSPPLVLEVVLAFVGASKARRPMRLVVWGIFGVLAALSFGGLFSVPLSKWTDELSWSVWFLVGWVVAFAYQIVLLVRHLKANTDVREQARARIVLAALSVGGAFSTSDVARGLGLPTPYLGAAGTLIAACLLATLVIRHELFDRSVSLRTAVYVVAMIAAFVVAYFVALSALAGRLAFQLLAACLLTLLGAAVTRELALSLADRRARVQRLAILGRFAAQMAHDVKGPLTALLGSLELAERGRDRASDDVLDVVGEQARRIAAIVERYDRMARVEPQRSIVRVNAVVRAVARSHGVPESSLSLAEDDPECDADRALVESAVENVVRNAVEATTDATQVHVTTTQEDRTRAIVIRIRDEGPGMDARVLERATEEFFTTKPEGSGLGLAFARRVLEAHGGTLMLQSRRGQGTTVELRLPPMAPLEQAT